MPPRRGEGRIRGESTRRGFRQQGSGRVGRGRATRVSLWYRRASPFVVMDELIPVSMGAAIAVLLISAARSEPPSTRLAAVCDAPGETRRLGGVARELASTGDDGSSVDCADDGASVQCESPEALRSKRTSAGGRGGTAPPPEVLLDPSPLSDDYRTLVGCGFVMGPTYTGEPNSASAEYE